MMTREEWKEDRKSSQGDPTVLRRIRERQRNLAIQRMLQNAEEADVVVTNPQRLAVALRYRQGEMTAPRVVAKGMNRVAEKIRAVARQKSIPIVENRPLARALYQMCSAGSEVPEKLYRPVAELLAYVMKLRERARAREVTP
jgi:flagellar biosynthetic protein FlhB